MITEKEVFEEMIKRAELRIGAPCSDFGTIFRKKENYKGPLTVNAMGRELWNKYCRERRAYTKKNDTN